ncbi:hypothetical protein NC652_007982 [Populus alba x Populus x berolinensis]|nr:hypothetical protein NC652_007982 [Populus alba x Populus x berolinensis]
MFLFVLLIIQSLCYLLQMLFDAQTTIAMGAFQDFIKSIVEPDDEIIEMENDKRRAAVTVIG